MEGHLIQTGYLDEFVEESRPESIEENIVGVQRVDRQTYYQFFSFQKLWGYVLIHIMQIITGQSGGKSFFFGMLLI